MSCKIYVGNLNYATTEQGLRNLFEAYGSVLSQIIIKDKITRRSKGFGFVEFEESTSAEKAIEALNGSEFEGRQLRVNYADDKPRA